MKTLLKSVSIAALGATMSIGSYAGMITDVENVDTYLNTGLFDVLSLNFDSIEYTHTLGEPGEDPFTLGSAISGQLAIEVWDDQQCLFSCNDDWAPEIALFTVEEFDFDTGGFNFGSSFLGDLEINALAALNASGELDITITSLGGDFRIGTSTLTVITDDTVAVPEPATTALLGLGLVALFVSRRRMA